MPTWFEDLPAGRCDVLGRVTVDRGEVLQFAGRYDPQPFHLDEAAAAAHPLFGRLSASGWHTAALAMRLTVDFWQAHDVRGLGSPGLDELAWPHPVFPGDVLAVASEILEARPLRSRPAVGLLKIRTVASNQDGIEVMRQVANVMVARRPG